MYATFVIEDAELERIRTALEIQSSIDRLFEVNLVDQEGIVHACIEKTIYIRRKDE